MATQPRTPKTILAVEDDPIIQRALEKALKGSVKIVCVGTGKEALAALSDHAHPAFVLLDYMLPDMDGLQVLTKVRAQPRTATLPVVMFSSLSDPNRVRAAMAAGANSWVTKTDDPKAFEAAVQAIASYWLHVNTHP